MCSGPCDAVIGKCSAILEVEWNVLWRKCLFSLLLSFLLRNITTPIASIFPCTNRTKVLTNVWKFYQRNPIIQFWLNTQKTVRHNLLHWLQGLTDKLRPQHSEDWRIIKTERIILAHWWLPRSPAQDQLTTPWAPVKPAVELRAQHSACVLCVPRPSEDLTGDKCFCTLLEK